MKKWLLLGLAIMLVVSAVGVGGCGGKTGLSGKYVHEDDPESYLELKSDGTFYANYDVGLLQDGYRYGIRSGVSGTYKIEGDTIIMSTELGAAKFWIKDNALWDEQDKKWVKQSALPEAKEEEREAGTIEVPGGPRIKVVFNGPPELEVSWEKLGTEGGQVHLIGTLHNVSNQTVKFSTIDFLFDGWQVAYIRGQTLEPGEQMRILKGFPGYTEITKVLEVRISGFEQIGGSETKASEPATPTPVSAATLEVANFDLSELLELREAIEQFITSARLIANEEERQLLSQANVVLAAIQSNSNLHNIVAEKTEEEQLILDVLGGIFSVGVEHFYKIPSPVAWAIAKGAEELGNRIAEWQVLGHLSFATVTQPGNGVMEVVYHKEQGEVWVNFNIYDPVGRVAMYIPVEPRLVSSEGRGNVVLSEGVRPVMEKSRIAYRLGSSVTTPPEPEKTVFTSAPRTPQTPAEVVAAFYFLCQEGKYSEAERLSYSGSIDKVAAEGFFRGRELSEVRIEYVDIIEGGVFIRVIWSDREWHSELTSMSKSNLLALMKTGPLLREIKPYEIYGETYKQEVIRQRYAEFLRALEFPREIAADEVEWIRVGEEFTREEEAGVGITLHFKDGSSEYSGGSLVKEDGKWKLKD